FLDFFGQRGRNGLANISRLKYGISAAWPYRDENELVQLSFTRAHYAPTDDRSVDGNILSARVQGKCCDSRLFLYGQANLEQYDSRIKDRITYDAGVGYDISDLFHVRASGFLENVIENGESIRQDIYRLGTAAGLDIHATRYGNLS